MRHIDPFVTELTTDFVHALDTSDDELFEVKLGRDAHVERHVQVVVVGDERSRGGTTGDHIHHRRLNLKEIAIIQVLADVSNDVGSDVKRVANFVVHHQIQKAHAEARFDILQPRKTGKHLQARGQDLKIRREQRELPTFRLPGRTLDADNVPASRRAVNLLEIISRCRTLIRGHLNLLTIRNKIVKVQFLPARPFRHDASRHGRALALGRRPIRQPGILFDKLPHARIDVILVRIRRLSLRFRAKHLINSILRVLRRVQIRFVVLFALLLLRLCRLRLRLGRVLGRLLLFVLSLFQPFLILTLAHRLARELRELLQRRFIGGVGHVRSRARRCGASRRVTKQGLNPRRGCVALQTDEVRRSLAARCWPGCGATCDRRDRPNARARSCEGLVKRRCAR
mmetsp:Transcript_5069/g.19568  ORF Transcript_5069/g.19568 Transcript_5069/m.19568 type:complete len:398 (+) Transcript_5069:860-2053(+)